VTLLVDWAGNNAAVKCTECGGVYIVSTHLHKKGRVCPHCGKTRAYATLKDKSVVMGENRDQNSPR
jgi:NAD-dependent SIR2 family protein deacetylase